MQMISFGKNLRITLFFVMAILPFILGACGGSSGSTPLAKVAVVNDFYDPAVADFLTSKGLTAESFNIDNPSELTSLQDNLGDYGLIVFGDKLYSVRLTAAPALFDAADAAGIAMLGIGTADNDWTIGSVLVEHNRFGLSSGATSDSNGYPMHVEVTSTGQTHAIFNGIDTSSDVVFAVVGSQNDEQYYNVDATDPNAPADWTVLANLGADMTYNGNPTIVEFTTANNTRVMLDGSANTYENTDYLYWNQTRWDVLYNQAIYLLTN